MAYPRLTKKIINDDGEEAVICSFYGTNQCPFIHSDALTCEAVGCQVPKIMMRMLFEYENAITNDNNGLVN